MNQTDVYYRALLSYRRETDNHRACVRDNRLYAEADGHGTIQVTRVTCTVDEAWIAAIEEGLVHIEKAIKEERQFIYSNGEVVPIEKVKNISKDSVQHLARHAEMITRVHEGEDIIPDSLYTVERLSDYAVYENRFLYMLLCYLRDFVTLRYQNILELTNRYEGNLSIGHTVKALNRDVDIRIELAETRRDDPYLRDHNPAKALIDRMDLILKTVLSFLATPLMESAGKAPMLKPPITKTNVLKMDNNFKGAVALYDYIIAYEGDGYTVEEHVRKIDPFFEGLTEDMAEAERLLSFLTYRYGLDLDGELKAVYEAEEAKRRDDELREKTEQMETIRRRLANEGQPIEAYILFLEEQARTLQNEVDRLPSLYAEIEERQAAEHRLQTEVEDLTEHLKASEKRRLDAEVEHAEEVRRLNETYTAELTSLRDTHAAEIASMQASHAEEVTTLTRTHGEAIAALGEEHDRAMTELRTDRDGQLNVLRERLLKETAELEAVLAERTDERDALTEESRQQKAQIMGLRAKAKNISTEEMDALTEEAAFDELERELEAFVRFYKTQWSKTKRKIRKDLLNLKYIKEQEKHDSSQS